MESLTIVGGVLAVAAFLRLDKRLKRVLAVVHRDHTVPTLTFYRHEMMRSAVADRDAWLEELVDAAPVATTRTAAPERAIPSTPAVPERPRADVLEDLRQAEADLRSESPTIVVVTPQSEPTVATADPSMELPVYFKPGEPTTFDTIGAQAQVVDYLSNAVRGLRETEQAIDPVILLGPPGLGKTTIAKVTANELRLRALDLELPEPEFIEVFPADVPSVQALDAIMRRVQRNPGSVLFIDEIHDVEDDRHWRKLYLFLQEGRYKFEGEANPVVMPPTTVLAATTDYGSIHPALLRRFKQKNLIRASADELKAMVRRRPFPISEPAVDLIVDRCGSAGAPWEVLEVYEEAIVYAKGSGRDGITSKEVRRVFENQGIDEYGLRGIDRQILSVLFQYPRTRMRRGEPEFVCFGQSETTVTSLAQVDKEYYRENIRPRLMSRGLLEIRSTYGQAITARGMELYHNLKPTFDATPITV